MILLFSICLLLIFSLPAFGQNCQENPAGRQLCPGGFEAEGVAGQVRRLKLKQNNESGLSAPPPAAGELTIMDYNTTSAGEDWRIKYGATGDFPLQPYAGASSPGGPATSATALASDPADCAANQYATAIAASGNLSCSQVGITQLSGLAISSPATGQVLVYDGGADERWENVALSGDVLSVSATGVVTLSAQVSKFGLAVDPNEMAVADFGHFSCNGTTCTLDSGVVGPAQIDQSANYTWTGSHTFNGTMRVPTGATVPTSCTGSELFVDNDAPSGQRLYLCVSGTFVPVDSKFGTFIDGSEIEVDFRPPAGTIINLYENSAALKLAITGTDATAEGVIAIDNSGFYELEWYAGGALRKLSDYLRLGGRPAGQAVNASNTADGSDNQALTLTGAGGYGAARGGGIALYGNEFGGGFLGGIIFLDAGYDAAFGDGAGYVAVRTGAATTERLRIDRDGLVSIGPGGLPGGTAPRRWFKNLRGTTTNATATNIGNITISADRTYFVEAIVVGRRTGGTAGAANDGAGYVLRSVYKTSGGTVTLIGTADKFIREDQSGWDANFVVSGTTLNVQVTGAADNNITWHASVGVVEVNA